MPHLPAGGPAGDRAVTADIPARWTRIRLQALTAAGVPGPDIGDTGRVTADLHDQVARLWATHVHGVDLDAAGFPHGTASGYDRGCRLRDGCRRAASRREIGARMRRGRPDSGPDAGVLAAHVRRLLADPWVASLEDVARAARCSRQSVNRAAAGQPLKPATQRRLAACTIRDARAATGGRRTAHVDVTLTRQQIGSMERLGWPVTWQASQVGSCQAALYAILRGTRGNVEVWLARAVAGLAARVGDRRGPSQAAARAAGERGWGPPAAYDEWGRPVPGALDRADGLYAGRRLDALRLILDGAAAGDVLRELAPDVDPDVRRLYTLTGMVGLTVHVIQGRIRIDPGQDGNLDLLRSHLATLTAGTPATQVWRALKAATDAASERDVAAA
jgi:hypothetical protein